MAAWTTPVICMTCEATSSTVSSNVLPLSSPRSHLAGTGLPIAPHTVLSTRGGAPELDPELHSEPCPVPTSLWLATRSNCRERLAVHNDRRRARSSGLSNLGGSNAQGSSHLSATTEAAGGAVDQVRLACMRHAPTPQAPLTDRLRVRLRGACGQ